MRRIARSHLADVASIANEVVIEMQAFADNVSPRHHRSGDDDDDEGPVSAEAPLLLDDSDVAQHRCRGGRHRRRRDLERLMLEGIRSNWAELLAYVAVMCLCHIIMRLAIVRTGLPSDQNAFQPAGQFNNYLLLAHCSSTAYLLGSVALTHVLRTSYMALVFAAALIFTMICEMPIFHTSLSYRSIQHWSLATIIGYSLASCALIVCLLHQWRLTWRWSKQYGQLYLTSIALVLGFHATLWALLPRGVHLHHWYCAWIYMFLLRSQDAIIIGAHAVATGIFLQGIASYGCASVLFNGR